MHCTVGGGDGDGLGGGGDGGLGGGGDGGLGGGGDGGLGGGGDGELGGGGDGGLGGGDGDGDTQTSDEPIAGDKDSHPITSRTPLGSCHSKVMYASPPAS